MATEANRSAKEGEDPNGTSARIGEYKNLLDIEEKLEKRVAKQREQLRDPAQTLDIDLGRVQELANSLKDLQSVRRQLAMNSIAGQVTDKS